MLFEQRHAVELCLNSLNRNLEVTLVYFDSEKLAAESDSGPFPFTRIQYSLSFARFTVMSLYGIQPPLDSADALFAGHLAVVFEHGALVFRRLFVGDRRNGLTPS